MPYSIGYSSLNTLSRLKVPINSKFAYRFYEPIGLLKALNAKCDNKPSDAPDSSTDMTQSPEHVFKRFVNTLAQLCDCEKGGDTVTSFAVLQHPDCIEYRFTSNQRNTEDFVRAQNFIASMLQILGSMQKYEKQSMISIFLRRSLSFGRLRVTLDLKILKDRAKECISACKVENTDESQSILRKLEELYEELLVFSRERLSHSEFTQHCESLIQSINRLHQSEVHEFICNRTKEGKIDESEKWSEFRHAAGRLHSYLRAAKLLVSLPKQWPELFDSPKVSYISSSIPDRCPFRGKRRPSSLTAGAIIGRMTSSLGKQKEYMAHADEMQKFGLDETLRRKAEMLKPFVHAEVLLLQSIESDLGTHHSKFFNGYKYIGSSKPTCRLCYYYFSVHPSGVEVRQTHRNLYPSWRLPDVYEDEGPVVEENRKDLMNKVLSLIRTDTFRVLKEKLAEGRRHDSNTSSSYPKDSASVGSIKSKDLTLAALDIQDAMSSCTETGSLDEDEEFAVNFGSEEDGGVRLF